MPGWRGGVLLQSMPSLGGWFLRILSTWTGARPSPASGAREFMACLPDAASHTSWAVRGIKTSPYRAGIPDTREQVR